MKSQRNKVLFGATLAAGMCCAAGVMVHAQTANRSGQNTVAGASQPASPAEMDAEREQLWNSPNMLRARAWLKDYCSKSAKVTPEMAKHYEDELQHMTVPQLQLWLLKFDQEEEQRQQTYSLWQQAHAAGLSQAMAANRATQQSYSNINREETQAATEDQQQLGEEQQFEQSESQANRPEAIGPYPNGYPGYGGTHYHFHLYPYPY